MTNSVNTSADYTAAMDQIRAEVEAYCEANNIDPDQYLDSLDGNSSLSVIDNPALEAYFQLAYVQLMAIINQDLITSLADQIGELGPEDQAIIAAAAGADLDQLVKDLIEDDPELMAVYARQAGGQSESDFLISYLTELEATEASDTSDDGSETTSSTDRAREYAEENDLPLIAELADKEDWFGAQAQAVLNRLDEYDQMMSDVVEQFNTGEITETEYQDALNSANYGREVLMVMLQKVTDGEANYFELISDILKNLSDTRMAITSSFKV